MFTKFTTSNVFGGMKFTRTSLANATNQLKPIVEATGGTTSTTTVDGVNYKLHTFNSSSTFSVTNGGNIDIFIVGGGGGGAKGVYAGAGGGGGGYTTTVSTLFINPGSFSITVGAGGGNSIAGNASSFANLSTTYTANGGFAPSTTNPYPGANGGSGGGGGTNVSNPASVGGSNGSDGVAGSIYGVGTGQGTTTRAFQNSGLTLYAGGGGGGGTSYLGGTAGAAGGAGGGGNGGGPNAVGSNGGTNLGGGGGGGGGAASGTGQNGGTGGSGIVIVRYPI